MDYTVCKSNVPADTEKNQYGITITGNLEHYKIRFSVTKRGFPTVVTLNYRTGFEGPIKKYNSIKKYQKETYIGVIMFSGNISSRVDC